MWMCLCVETSIFFLVDKGSYLTFFCFVSKFIPLQIYISFVLFVCPTRISFRFVSFGFFFEYHHYLSKYIKYWLFIIFMKKIGTKLWKQQQNSNTTLNVNNNNKKIQLYFYWKESVCVCVDVFGYIHMTLMMINKKGKTKQNIFIRKINPKIPENSSSNNNKK